MELIYTYYNTVFDDCQGKFENKRKEFRRNMKRKLLSVCIGLFAVALCGGAVACESMKPADNGNNNPPAPQGPSLEFERVDDGYAVVGIGTYEEGILVIPAEYDGEPVTTIGEKAFAAETEIGVLTVPDSVTTIQAGAFENCSNLTTVTIGKNVSYIADSAFAYCHSMESVSTFESVTFVGKKAFFGCMRLRSVAFSDALKTLSDSAFEVCDKLNTVTVGTGLETIGNRAFYGCKALKGLDIPDGAPTVIGNAAFQLCEAIEYVHLGNGVTQIGDSAFASCSLLRDVVLGDGVMSIGENAFSKCRKFYQLTLGESLVSIGTNAFDRCWLIREIYNRSSLTITLGSNDNGGVGLYAWYVRTGDEPTRIVKDENNGLVYYIEGERKSVIAIELSKSADVVIPDDVTDIGDYAGYGVQFITSLVIGDNCKTIGKSAFRNSYMIRYVKLGEKVETIDELAFRYNGYIVELVINKNLKTVGKEAFLKEEGDAYYRAYKTIFFEGTQAEWNAIRFASGNDHLIGLDDNDEPLVNLALYSESKPDEEGSYWHYVDGKPTLWN
ncbi:MAG: leucine-rich repeat domain-containing protein [Clostridiales bacterium]|nr:leucine-rich repeat domain-containing protein [Clostridiales bacterium]